jgi:hypothetical protein
MVAELVRAGAALLEDPPRPPAGLEELARRNARRHRRRRALSGAVVAVLAVVGLTVLADGRQGDNHVVTVARDSGTLAVATDHGVLLVPADGDAPTAVDLGGVPVRMAWSFDGEWLAAQVDGRLLLVHRPDGEVRRVDIPDVGGFAWSPVAPTLVVQSATAGLFTATPTGEPRQIRASGGDAAWSPDGRRLAIQDGGSGAGGLRVMDADGTAERLVASYRTLAHAAAGLQVFGWTPDGRAVLYRGHDVAGSPAEEGLPLVAVDVADGTTFELGPVFGRREWVVPAPEGSSVAFIATDVRSTEHVLRACDVVARECTDLTSADRVAADPAWSPDGTRIAYASTATGPLRAEGSTTHVVRAAGSDDQQVGPAAGSSRVPSWTGDGGSIVRVLGAALDADPPILVVDRIPASGGRSERLVRRVLRGRAVIADRGGRQILTAWTPGRALSDP